MSLPDTHISNQLSGLSSKPDYDVIIVGGGLAGLINAIVLAGNNKKVLLIEKKSYPYHKVCGEYVSNEVLPYLKSIGFDPFSYGAAAISRLRISTPKGKNVYSDLGLGAFGISRYTMDNELYKLALKKGATVLTNTKVTDIVYTDPILQVSTNKEIFTAKLVIAAYGKRDVLDKKLDRPFMKKHTRYLGVKYHIKTDYPANEIGLDNFEGGYCGISKIENDEYNLCYLYRRPKKKSYKDIDDLQANVLCKNPVLKNIFTSSDFLFDAPEVINEICFSPKEPVYGHLLMCGDSAGLITPLCGNGMAMAITSARLLSRLIISSKILNSAAIKPLERAKLESAYAQAWQQTFSRRLFWGRTIQGLFGNPVLTDVSVRLVHSLPPVERWLINKTHGKAVKL